MRDLALSRVMQQKACHTCSYGDGTVDVPPRMT